MTTKPSVLVFLTMLTLSLGAAESTNRLHFPATGFSIAPLEAPPGKTIQQSVMMWLPAAGGLSANVNVQLQPYAGTIDEYLALSLKQFKDVGAKVVDQKKLGDSTVAFEYTGEMQGHSLHWYARAEKSGDHVYLTTATTTEEQWAGQAAQLKACVDSFRCDRGEKASAPATATPQK